MKPQGASAQHTKSVPFDSRHSNGRFNLSDGLLHSEVEAMIAKKRHAGETAKKAAGFDALRFEIGGDRRILIAACARQMGISPRRFVESWIDAGIEGTLAEIDEDTLLTRRERAALKSPLSDWCCYKSVMG